MFFDNRFANIANNTVIGTLSVTSIKSHYFFTIRPTITIMIRPCYENDVPFIQKGTV